MEENKNIIVHFPWKLDYSRKSATSVRPLEIIEAFENLGFNTFVIQGTSKERKQLFSKLKQEIATGRKLEMVYLELSTWPLLLTGGFRKLFESPFIDYQLIRYYKKNNLPLGVFIRDIYWIFPHLITNLHWLKKSLYILLNKMDIKFISGRAGKIYLPSLNMLPYIERYITGTVSVSELHPGLNKKIVKKKSSVRGQIELLYIGGIGPHYRMQELVKALNSQDNCMLTLCCRKEEWEREKDIYPDLTNIDVVHKSGEDLELLYKKCHVGLILTEPGEYRSFAMPVKLFEYFGQGLPVAVSNETAVSEFVKGNDIGWCVDYSFEAIKKFLKDLSLEDITKFGVNSAKKADEHTWLKRVERIVNDLESHGI